MTAKQRELFTQLGKELGDDVNNSTSAGASNSSGDGDKEKKSVFGKLKDFVTDRDKDKDSGARKA